MSELATGDNIDRGDSRCKARGQRYVAAVNSSAALAELMRYDIAKITWRIYCERPGGSAAMNTVATASIAPVEYAVAVDRYLAEGGLGPASRRVYRISLASWTWPLVGK